MSVPNVILRERRLRSGTDYHAGKEVKVAETLRFMEAHPRHEALYNDEWKIIRSVKAKLVNDGRAIVPEKKSAHGLIRPDNCLIRTPELLDGMLIKSGALYSSVDYFNHHNYSEHFAVAEYFPNRSTEDYELDELGKCHWVMHNTGVDIRWIERLLSTQAYELAPKKSLLADMETIINYLERSWRALSFCSQKWLSSNRCAHGPGQLECEVCWREDTGPNDLIVICDGCQMAVHQQCYGIPLIPEGHWLCRKCTSFDDSAKCSLCPWGGGPLKKTTDLSKPWCHIFCAEFHRAEVQMLNPIFREPIDLHNIPRSRWHQRCYICGEKTGAPIQCSIKTCNLAMHPKCARFVACNIDRKNLSIKCPLHSEAALFLRPSSNDFRNCGDKDVSNHHFLHYPVVPRKVFNEVIALPSACARPLQDHIEFSRKVCRYWSLKRRLNLGYSLTKRFDADIWFTWNLKTSVQLLQDKRLLLRQLKLLRKICLDIQRREYAKRRSIRCMKEVFMLLWAPLRSLMSVAINEMR